MGAEPMQAIIDKIAGECVAVRVRMLNRAITNIYDDALRPLGLRASQLNILIVTAKLGPAKSARSCNSMPLPSAATSSRCRPTAGWRSCPARMPAHSPSG